MPWDKGAPHHLLERWLREREVSGDGRRALVVGCGMGRDSEYLAGLGFATVAFDFSPTAIAAVCRRFPDSPVDYRPADGLELVRLEDFRDPDAHRWRAELRRTEPSRGKAHAAARQRRPLRDAQADDRAAEARS